VSALGVLRRGRAAAERLMVDTCKVTRVTGEPGLIDPETGLREPPPTVTVYEGKCKVQTYEPNESRPEAGEHLWTLQRYGLHVPVGAGPVMIGDRIEITVAAADPQLVGRVFEVAGRMNKSMATAQRLLVDEVTG
jgi:hypothetical protein